MKKCKSKGCKAKATEASGYCFNCAEEFACLLADADFSSKEIQKIAWGKPSDGERSKKWVAMSVM